MSGVERDVWYLAASSEPIRSFLAVRREWPPVSAVAGHFPNLPATPAPFPYRAENAVAHRVGVPVNARGRSKACADPNGTKKCPTCKNVKAFPSRFEGYHVCNECRAKTRARAIMLPRGPRDFTRPGSRS